MINDELEDRHKCRTNIYFYHYGSSGGGLGSCKASLSPPPPPSRLPTLTVIHYRPFQGGTFIVVRFVDCYLAFHFLMFFF